MWEAGPIPATFCSVARTGPDRHIQVNPIVKLTRANSLEGRFFHLERWNWDKVKRALRLCPCHFDRAHGSSFSRGGTPVDTWRILFLVRIIAPPAQGRVVAFGPLERSALQGSAKRELEKALVVI